jgi:hypothetical protein
VFFLCKAYTAAVSIETAAVFNVENSIEVFVKKIPL